jgi:hypothetical protein
MADVLRRDLSNGEKRDNTTFMIGLATLHLPDDAFVALNGLMHHTV